MMRSKGIGTMHRQARWTTSDGRGATIHAQRARDDSRESRDDSEGFRDEAQRARDLALQSIGGGSIISIGTFETDANRPAWQLIATGLVVPARHGMAAVAPQHRRGRPLVLRARYR